MRFLVLLLLVPLRVAGLLTLLIAGLVIAGLAYPWLAQPRRNRITRRWSALLLAVCGARLRPVGALPPALARDGMQPGEPGRLLLINHISWIDIFAVNAVLPSRFVAKAEIGRWPLLGTLVTLAGTLYIERGRRHAVHAVNHKVAEHLQLGESVALFPEGTTTDGSELLPFHSNLIAPVMEAGGLVWPVALRYTEDGRPSRAAAFIGDDTLARSIWNILTARRLAIEVALLDPVAADGETHPTRHHVAQAARERIAAYLRIGVG
jgi:1-acyl-sn-glycerol-3-phosphate acyltransferase